MQRGVQNPPAASSAGRVVEFAKKAFELVHPYLNSEDQAKRIGGFLCFASVEHGGMFCAEIAKRDPELFPRFRFNAGEKVDRLDARLKEGHNDRSTFVTRDITCEPKKWGGGIRAGDFFVAFSGLPEYGDEALCLCVAVWARLIGFSEAKEIAAISGNQIFFKMIDDSSLRGAPD